MPEAVRHPHRVPGRALASMPKIVCLYNRAAPCRAGADQAVMNPSRLLAVVSGAVKSQRQQGWAGPGPRAPDRLQALGQTVPRPVQAPGGRRWPRRSRCCCRYRRPIFSDSLRVTTRDVMACRETAAPVP